MLTGLKIENVAVIEKAEIAFSTGFNALTGETGAGKSILIDSINSILGNRTSKDLIRTGADKARISAVFDEIPTAAVSLLQNAGYDVAEELLLYREISREGKSVCRVNGMPATAAFLHELGGALINIYGQHDSQNLTDSRKHISILDLYSQNEEIKNSYRVIYHKLVEIKKRCDSLKLDELQRQREIDYLQYEISELEGASVQPGEEEELKNKKKLFDNASAISKAVALASQFVNGFDDNGGACDALRDAAAETEKASQYDSRIKDINEKLMSSYYAVQEIGRDLSNLDDEFHFDENEINEIQSRLEAISHVCRKYNLQSDQIADRLQKDTTRLAELQNATQTLSELEQEKKALYLQARQAADVLTRNRKEAFEKLNCHLKDELAFLNMPGIQFELQCIEGPLTSNGRDNIEFLISANRGEEPKPLSKIASGGELSRIMLALKSTLAERDAVPTVIYDEIDTGVSGLAAQKIGMKLRSTSHNRQVLCITHTAQIAAMADNQLLIRKQSDHDRTYTVVEQLSYEKRIQVLASMISGDKVTAISLQNAQEMLSDSQ